MAQTITHNSMRAAVGNQATVVENGLTIVVLILDAKAAWGSTRYLVTPLAGSGQKWVSADRVTVTPSDGTAHDADCNRKVSR